MPITDRLVLPADVVLAPVSELSAAVRRRLTCEDDDYALTRPRLRAGSRIVEARAAELLTQFKALSTVAEAVVRHSRATGADPQTVLLEAYPLLASLLDAGFLASESDGPAADLLPTAYVGENLAGYEVVRCVQALEDVELYQVRRKSRPAGRRRARAAAAAKRRVVRIRLSDAYAALKIERPAAAGRCAAALAREAAVLEHLSGEGAPRLLAAGALDGRHFVVTEWCPGIDVVTAAGELRAGLGADGLAENGGGDGAAGRGPRAALLALAAAVARAYAGLHERGVIHGDVHPRNVMVAADCGVRLLDFGLARWSSGPRRLARPGRGGIGFFFEPEYARAALAGRRRPAASAAGEQYAVTALLYLLLTGTHYRDFSLERDALFHQVAEEPPLPFAERGAAPWPEVESLLARGLSKEPEQRFESLAELAAALDGVRAVAERAKKRKAAAAARPRSGHRAPSAADALLDRVLARIGPDGPLAASGLAEPPYASINYGAAGVAYALYRIALVREDPILLAQADLWAGRARQAGATGNDDAFYHPESEITEATVGRVSPYHTATGPWAVQALIAHVQGETGAQRAAVAAFLAAARQPCANPDLVLGRCGLLLAAALLLDTTESARLSGAAVADLRQFGGELLAALWQELDEMAPIPLADGNLGIAHGWGGYLYASLRWCRAAGVGLPSSLRRRLDELGESAEHWQRGLRWRWHGAESEGPWESPTMPGWCNGSAGLVHLWTLAHRHFGDPSYAALAEGAAWNSWEGRAGGASLCCGLAGRAYALLNLHRHGGGADWLRRARILADRAARQDARNPVRPDSLYKGGLGVAVLAADLAHPEDAAMPFFQEEGWRD